MSYNARQKLRDNIDALREVLSWNGIDSLTNEQVETISKFKGWGSLKILLYTGELDIAHQLSEADRKLIPLVKELYTLLKEHHAGAGYNAIVESIRNATLTSYYTPECIVDTFYETLWKYHRAYKVYDPCTGSGLFIKGLLKQMSPVDKITAYEKDHLTARIASALYRNRNCTIYNSPLEESSSEEDGQYDLVASNPPYGQFPVYDPQCSDKNLSGKIHNYFIWKGLQKLKDKGLLCYLITDSFLNSPSNSTARKYLYSNADHISLTVMPDNLMWESAGTMAPSHFIVVRKRVGKTEADMTQEEQWLCQAGNVLIKRIPVAVNEYVKRNQKCVIGKSKVGKNQYGKPAIETIWDDSVEEAANRFGEILERDLQKRYKKKDTGNWMQAAIAVKEYIDRNELSDEEEETNVDDWKNIGIEEDDEEEEYWAHRLEQEIEDNKKDGVLGQEIDDNPFGVGESIPEQTEEESRYYADEYDKANWEEREDYTESREVAEQQGDAYDEEEVHLEENISPKLSGIFSNNGWTEEQLQEQYDRLVEKGLIGEESVAKIDNICDKKTDEKTTVNIPEGTKWPEPLPFKPGTIIAVSTGSQENLFEEKSILVMVNKIDKEGTIVEWVPAPVKEGREEQVMRSYMEVRDVYINLQKEE